MPIYEYICNTCEHSFERLVTSSNDTTNIQCPECGTSDVKKIISAPSPAINRASPTTTGCNQKSPFS